MVKKNKRPVYLNLFKIHLPIGGFVSIIHRVTGVVLVPALALSLYFLELSLEGERQFNDLSVWLGGATGRISVGIIVWLFAQHLFSGLRHLLLDLDIGVEKSQARVTASLGLRVS